MRITTKLGLAVSAASPAARAATGPRAGTSQARKTVPIKHFPALRFIDAPFSGVASMIYRTRFEMRQRTLARSASEGPGGDPRLRFGLVSFPAFQRGGFHDKSPDLRHARPQAVVVGSAHPTLHRQPASRQGAVPNFDATASRKRPFRKARSSPPRKLGQSPVNGYALRASVPPWTIRGLAIAALDRQNPSVT